MNFYTGLSTISTFSVLFSLFHLNLSNMQYWRGTSRHILNYDRKRKFSRSSRMISSYTDEFLLTLMKLRLGLLNEDLADRFWYFTCNMFKYVHHLDSPSKNFIG